MRGNIFLALTALIVLAMGLVPPHAKAETLLVGAWLGRMADAPDLPSRNGADNQTPGAWQDIVVKASPMVSAATLEAQNQPPPDSGKLHYLGGLILTSRAPQFGGLSAMRFVPRLDGTGTALLALSDRGQWFFADIAFDKHGVPSGLGHVRMAKILGRDTIPLKTMAADAESLALTRNFLSNPANPEGGVIVGFERYHRLDQYLPDEDGVFQLEKRVLHNRIVRGLNNNQSLESVARLEDDRLIILAEAPPEGSDDDIVPGWISLPDNWRMGGDDWVPLKYQPAKDFSVTEMAVDRIGDKTGTGKGDLYILERAFSPLAGPRARLSRVRADNIQPGTMLPAEELGRLNVAWGIDNMEGMDVRRLPDGRVLIYILSDDNFSINQRTVLMVFSVVE